MPLWVRAMTSQPPGQLSFDFGFETALRTIPVARERAIGVGLVARPRAEFIPFPLARRRPLVAKLAAQMVAASTSQAAENLLRGRLARLGRGLRRRRVSEQAICGEMRSLEAAVRLELWRACLLDHANG
jgi:hypothetical protein